MVSEEEVIKQFKNLRDNKATTYKNISGKILKENADVYYSTVTNIVNSEFENDSYPNSLKLADVIPGFKSGDRTNT